MPPSPERGASSHDCLERYLDHPSPLRAVALIVAGFVIRAGVFSPTTVQSLLEDEQSGDGS
jgi:hypothetical protein